VHDDAQGKDFELDMAWTSIETGSVFSPVPQDLHDEAERKAKEAMEGDLE
jgi:20S proteasome subunit alpha 7